MGIAGAFVPVEAEREYFSKTFEVIDRAIEQKNASAISFAVWRASEPRSYVWSANGTTRFDEKKKPVNRRTVYDLASLTKIIGTSTLTALLVERGWLQWETPVSSIIQGFPYSKIQIRHLLAHTSGYGAWDPLYKKLLERAHDEGRGKALSRVTVRQRQKWMREEVLSVVPECPPDERAVYSDIGFLVLGFCLEEILSIDLDKAFRRYVFRPWKLSSMKIHRTSGFTERGSYAATEECPWRGLLQGQVHDDNCWAMGGYSAHAGIFGALDDVMRFASTLFQGKGVGSPILQKIWTPVSLPKGCSRTLGWDTPSRESSLGAGFSRRSVGHLGFTGTSLWIDLEHGIAMTLLTNRVHPSRENDTIRQLRVNFHNALWSDLNRR